MCRILLRDGRQIVAQAENIDIIPASDLASVQLENLPAGRVIVVSEQIVAVLTDAL